MIRVVVLPPVVFFLETKHLLDLPIAQRRLPLVHLARDGRVRRILLEKLLGGECSRDGIIGSIEDLEAEVVFLHAQVANLAEIAGIDVGPGVALAHLGVLDVLGEVAGVLVGFDDVADAQGVDVCVEAAGKATGYALAAELRDGVGVHRIDVCVFDQGEGSVVEIALPKADLVGGLAAGDDDLLDSELTGCFDDVVG